MSGPPRTPPLVYALALLVVLGVYLVWRGSRDAGEDRLARWTAEALAPEEIEERLAGNDPEATAHALVQLGARLGRPGAALPAGFLERNWPRLDEIARSPEALLRRNLTPVLAFAPDPRADALLRGLLEDEDPAVALNAAIGLAARGDAAGAALLRTAIAGTRGEQAAQRRELLRAFRHVARPDDRAFLADELERARLDRDEERIGYCRDALARLDAASPPPR